MLTTDLELHIRPVEAAFASSHSDDMHHLLAQGRLARSEAFWAGWEQGIQRVKSFFAALRTLVTHRTHNVPATSNC